MSFSRSFLYPNSVFLLYLHLYMFLSILPSFPVSIPTISNYIVFRFIFAPIFSWTFSFYSFITFPFPFSSSLSPSLHFAPTFLFMLSFYLSFLTLLYSPLTPSLPLHFAPLPSSSCSLSIFPFLPFSLPLLLPLLTL
jgi:hypothetical protein